MGKFIPVEPEKWAEMVNAMAEVERLKEKSACQAECLEAFDKENARLKTEVKRLRKAGDGLAHEIVACYRAEGFNPADSEYLSDWNAAKEGKPSV